MPTWLFALVLTTITIGFFGIMFGTIALGV